MKEPMKDLILVAKARSLALSAHGNQCYGNRPYEEHLRAVVKVLRRFGVVLGQDDGTELICAAWLHDTREDTEVRNSSIVAEFGHRIADIVERVTDEPGENRKARKRATYPKIVESDAAVIVKLADRIANVEDAAASNPRLFSMYAAEHEEFSEALNLERRGELLLTKNDFLIHSMYLHLDSIFRDAKERVRREEETANEAA